MLYITCTTISSVNLHSKEYLLLKIGYVWNVVQVTFVLNEVLDNFHFADSMVKMLPSSFRNPWQLIYLGEYVHFQEKQFCKFHFPHLSLVSIFGGKSLLLLKLASGRNDKNRLLCKIVKRGDLPLYIVSIRL